MSYSVTELLEGSDLRDRLAGHALPLSRVLKIGRAVAEGLAAAHGKGIIHRDIKPGNIFVTKTGQVKILDFGIAGLRKDFESDAADSDSPTRTLTKAGQLIGTTAYMSPEQVAGKPADARSDIFSLGCVLYEMLTGRAAFDGQNPNETLVAIVSKDPTPISELRSDVPSSLELVVQRCLEKERDERFESARDVAFALEALSDDRVSSRPIPVVRPRRFGRNLRAALVGAAVVITALAGWKLVETRLPLIPDLPEQKHIAVIDFQAPEGDQGLIALADGLTETVSESLRTLELQSHGAIWVVPRRHRKPGEPWTLESVSKAHGATLGLTGQVQSRDGKLRLELMLRAPGVSKPLRRVVIEDQVDNLVAFQETPLVRVAEMLGVQLDPGALDEFREASTTVVPALASYISGVGRLVRATDAEGLVSAREDFETATDLDPTFSRARAALLASCASLIEIENPTPDPNSCVKLLPLSEEVQEADVSAGVAGIFRAMGENESAVEWMTRAVKQRPDDAELQLRLGRDLQRIPDLDAAEGVLNRAVDLRPDYWEGYYYLGFVDYVRGEYEATANAWRVAVRCAPGRNSLYSNLGAVFYYLNRHDQAFPMFERAIELDGEADDVALSNLGTMYFENARYAEAAETFQKALQLDDGDYRIWGYLAWSYASGVDPARAAEPFRRAVALAEEVLVKNPGDAEVLARAAGYYGMLGDRARGIELVEHAIELDPQDPRVVATVGETLEDLNDRDRALEWIERALSGGIPHTRFESHPSLRDLVADDRYKQMVMDPSLNVDSGPS